MLFPRDGIQDYRSLPQNIVKLSFYIPVPISLLSKRTKRGTRRLTILNNTNTADRSQTERNLVPRIPSLPSLATRL